MVREAEAVDVVHRWQADRRPVGVERRAEQLVRDLGVQVPQHPVVGHVRRERPTREGSRRVVRRGQEDRTVGRVDVADAKLFDHRPRSPRPAAGRSPATLQIPRLPLRGFRTGRPSSRPRAGAGRPARARRPVYQRAHRGADRHQRHADLGQSLAHRAKPEESGGAHTCTSAPSSRNRTASPTSGSTSPRPPYVDNNTRIPLLPSPEVPALLTTSPSTDEIPEVAAATITNLDLVLPGMILDERVGRLARGCRRERRSRRRSVNNGVAIAIARRRFARAACKSRRAGAGLPGK